MTGITIEKKSTLIFVSFKILFLLTMINSLASILYSSSSNVENRQATKSAIKSQCQVNMLFRSSTPKTSSIRLDSVRTKSAGKQSNVRAQFDVCRCIERHQNRKSKDDLISLKAEISQLSVNRDELDRNESKRQDILDWPFSTVRVRCAKINGIRFFFLRSINNSSTENKQIYLSERFSRVFRSTIRTWSLLAFSFPFYGNFFDSLWTSLVHLTSTYSDKLFHSLRALEL